jgi:DNA-binding response OmpR family regulator
MLRKQDHNETSEELYSAGAGTTPHTNRRAKILIIDDEVGSTRLLKLNLEQTGRFAVRTENISTAGLEAAIDFAPDLILLDVIMPGIDGGELAGILRADARLAATPIVFLTAVATKTEVQNSGGDIGGMPFLAKPAGLAEVLACLDQNLKMDRV